MRALILSAADPYQDRWHGLRRSTQRLQEILSDDGLDVDIIESVGDVAEALPGAELLAVNLAGADRSDPDALALDDAIGRHVQSGRAILSMHSTIIALGDLPQWRRVMGGAWHPGRSMHPQIGRHPIQLHAHGIQPGFDMLAPYDERYSALDVDADVLPIASHVHDGIRHVLAWSQEHDSGSRCVVNALGHGTESFDDIRHRTLISHMVAWALEPISATDANESRIS